jgi:hypothetical protein
LLLAAVVLASGCSRRAALDEREVATRVMAAHLQSTLHPKAVLVLSNPFAQMPGRPAEVYRFEEAGISGLKQGFGKDVRLIVAAPELKPEAREDPGSVPVDPKTTTPLSFLAAADAFDKAIHSATNCELVVSLIGLPADISRFEAWNRPGPPRFALLLPDCRMIGSAENVRTAFVSGKLAAAVVRKPGSAAAGKQGDPSFEDRFILVTSSNVDEFLGKIPQAFGF